MWSLLFSSAVAFTLLAVAAVRLELQVATSRRLSRGARNDFPVLLAATNANANHDPSLGPNRPGGLDGFMAPGEKPWWMRFGLGNRPPAPPEIGRQAQVRWWERARALVGLALVILSLAVLLLGSLGALFLVGSYLLEQLV